MSGSLALRLFVTGIPLAAAWLAPVAAAEPAEPTEVAAGVHLFRGAFVAGRQPDGNSVVLSAPDGLIVVDTGRHPAHTQRLLDFAATRKQPVAAIVNTHWHLDHVGGNALVRGRYPAARLHATAAIAAARGGFLAGYRSQLEALLADPARTAAEKEQFRSELGLIAGSASLDADVVIGDAGAPPQIAGRSLELHVARGATDGDLWLFDRATGVLIAGDLVTLPAPFFDTACPRAWQASLERLAATDFRILVPGHGPSLDVAGFARYRTAFDHLLACADSERAGGDCVAGWLADAGSLVGPEDEKLAHDLVGYYVDRVLRDPARKACA